MNSHEQKEGRLASSLLILRRNEVLLFDKLSSGDLYNSLTPLMLLHCYPWSRVMWQILVDIIQILSPHHSSFLLCFPSTFASSMISVKLNAVYVRHKLMMLWLMFAACVESSKACGNLRNSMFRELETG